MQVFEITKIHHDAAQLIAEGNLTNREIAEKVGVVPGTIWDWKKRQPKFIALVDEYLAQFQDEARQRGVANVHRRVKALNDRWNRLQRIVEERADAEEMATVPGGKTGLITKNVKAIGKGEDFQVVDIYEIDTGLLRELREHEKQAAQELGQWADRREVSGPNSGPIETNSTVSVQDRAEDKVNAWRKQMIGQLMEMVGETEPDPQPQPGASESPPSTPLTTTPA